MKMFGRKKKKEENNVDLYKSSFNNGPIPKGKHLWYDPRMFEHNTDFGAPRGFGGGGSFGDNFRKGYKDPNDWATNLAIYLTWGKKL
ncbi:MAG: hypothetical protein HDS11_02470 [Bacteroides sp.]|nr:hypothetical protein [Bacteroides sp.]